MALLDEIRPMQWAGLFVIAWILIGWVAGWRRHGDYGWMWVIVGAGLGPLALFLPSLNPPVRCLFCGRKIPSGTTLCPGCDVQSTLRS